MVRVLLVEDDPLIVSVLVYYLQRAEIYEVTCAATAGDALAYARDKIDIILLDVLLPDANGIDLCSHLRQWQSCPIIFISCLDDSETIIKGLAAGGDDFVTKPFNNHVLLARIEANLRRYEGSLGTDKPHSIQCGDLELNTDRQTVSKHGVPVHLSSTEFRILSYLMSHADKHFTPRELYSRIWNSPCIGDSRTVLVHIHNLRQKLEDDPANPRYIVMEWGKGYTFRSSVPT